MVDVAKKGSIKWTAAARLQLLRAVIRVEEHLITTPKARKWNWSDKWTAVANLLPIEFREKSWNRKRQQFYEPKCYRTFNNLLQAFRDKLAGKETGASRWVLSELEFRLLERYGDLVNARCPVPRKSSFRLVNRMCANAGSEKELRSATSNSVEVQSTSPVRKLARAERSLKHAHALDRGAPRVFEDVGRTEDTSIGQDMYGKTAKIEWSEAARVRVLEALIQVEEEIRNNCADPISPSTGRPMGKWERVANLLPHELRGRTWDPKARTYKGYKCTSLFCKLVKIYRITQRRSYKGPPHYMLPKPVYELLKKREDLLSTQTLVRADERRSIGRETEPAATGISENSIEWARPEEAFDSDDDEEEAQKNRIHHGNSVDKHAAESFQGSPCGSLSASPGPDYHRYRVSSNSESAFRSFAESIRSEGMAKPFSRPGVQTRALDPTHTTDLSSWRRSPSNHSPGSSSTREGTSTTHSRYEEQLHSTSDMCLRRLDVEFSQLSKWLQDRSIPFMRRLASEVNTYAIKSSKRRKLNFNIATEPVDDLLGQSQRRWIDIQIRNSFQKLKVEFAKELKNTSVEIAEVIDIP